MLALVEEQSQSMADKLVPPPLVKKSSFGEVDKMRREIRQLQEKRTAAMMNEVIELQRERDMATGMVKMLKQTMEDLKIENLVLKETVGRDDQVQRLFYLEKSLLEEQLYSNDLKKKLQIVNKKNASLESKIKSEQRSTDSAKSMLNAAEEDSNLERSRSMNDLEWESEKEEQQKNGGSPHSQNHPSSKQKDSSKDGTASLAFSVHKHGFSTPTFSSSPTVIPRRYKLAAIQTKTIGIQVNLAHLKDITEPRTQVIEEDRVQNEIVALLDKNKTLESIISELNMEKYKEEEERKLQKDKYQGLKMESGMLQQRLSDFSRWVRQKIQQIEEDIDVCRVIYNLHGSLSQETSLLRELQDRLEHSEERRAELDATNRRLKETVIFIEEKYKKAKQQIELLKQKVVLLTPVARSPKQAFFTSTSPLTSSPRLQRTTQRSNSLSLHRQPSPLLREATPTGHGRSLGKNPLHSPDNNIV